MKNIEPNSCEKITKLSLEAQNQKLRLFSRVDLPMKIEILKLQKECFHRIKTIYSDEDNVILTFASLILAIDNVTNKVQVEDLNTAKFKGLRKRSKSKRDKLLGYWAIIKSLRNEQSMSFRDISMYLLKYHKLSVAHSTLFSMWNELEQSTFNKE